MMDTPAETEPQADTTSETEQENNVSTKREAERTTEEENAGAPPAKRQNTGSSSETSSETSSEILTDTTTLKPQPKLQIPLMVLRQMLVASNGWLKLPAGKCSILNCYNLTQLWPQLLV